MAQNFFPGVLTEAMRGAESYLCCVVDTPLQSELLRLNPFCVFRTVASTPRPWQTGQDLWPPTSCIESRSEMQGANNKMKKISSTHKRNGSLRNRRPLPRLFAYLPLVSLDSVMCRSAYCHAGHVSNVTPHNFPNPRQAWSYLITREVQKAKTKLNKQCRVHNGPQGLAVIHYEQVT